MSVPVLAMVQNKRIGGGPLRKAIMMIVAWRAADSGRSFYVSKRRLAAQLECSQRTVIRHVQALVADGILHEVGQQPCASGHTIEYAVNLAAVAALEDIIPG
jgi:hypothetical protein